MAETSSRSRSKRPFLEDEDSEKPPAQKKVRFPKGKKVKAGEAAPSGVDTEDIGPATTELRDPRRAAKERAQRRSQITTELLNEEGEGSLNDVYRAEVVYEDNENFIEDGIQIEPFNLNQEREEGYFDDQGNFVEYVGENEIKDAWLDSIEDYPKDARAASTTTNNRDNNEVVIEDLPSEEIGMIKRRIANVLEPGETVLQALRRLKGASNNRKEKMSVETKCVFDQLTEDAMKLMEDGDYNVYHERQEAFEREAEGYERLAQARGKNTSDGAGYDMFSDTTDVGVASKLPDSTVGTSGSHANGAAVRTNGTDGFDMFADDEENVKRSSELELNVVDQSLSAVNLASEARELESDYVYDDSSGYYYSSSLGYYYDPSTGLYCSAASGQWYSFNEETGKYEEVASDGVASATSGELQNRSL